jgi:hypothetical protein
MKVWCERHWRPYAERRGNGLKANAQVIQALVDSQEFQTRCGEDATADRQNKVLGQIVAEFGGVCCFLGDDKMAEILSTSPNDPTKAPEGNFMSPSSEGS